MDRRFSTRLISHMESSYMSLYIRLGVRPTGSPITIRTPALPDMLVKRGAQIMGDGTQQIVKLFRMFRPGHGRFLLPLPGNIFFFQRHGYWAMMATARLFSKSPGGVVPMNSHDAIDRA